MADKTKVESFTQDWNKTVEWAKSKNIPYNVYYPIYQQDSQKLISSGSGMSESERIQAIQAAQGLNATTALPTDAPDPANLVGNAKSNAGQIFTGLEPTSLISNIFDTVKNTLAHPSSLYGFFEPQAANKNIDYSSNPFERFWQGGESSVENTLKNMSQHVLAPHSILSWFPGAEVGAQAVKGKAGLAQIADNPLTSLLDVIPLGDEIPKAFARSEQGAAVASKLGVTTDDLSKMGGTTFGYRMLKTITPPGGARTGASGALVHAAFMFDKAGNPTGIRAMNIGERINAYRNVSNIGKEQGDLQMGAITKAQEGTRRLTELAGPAVEALGHLDEKNNGEYTLAMKVLSTDHRAEGDILSDAKIPEAVRAALGKVYDYAHVRLQTKLQTGEMIAVETQFGTEYYAVKPGSSGTIVTRALDKSKKAQDTLDEKAKPLDALIYKTQIADQKMQGIFAIQQQMTDAIYGAIRSGEPELAGIDHAIGDEAKDVLWDKVVSTQSPIIRNLLGFPKQVDSAATKLFPDLQKAGRDLTKHDVNAIRSLFSPGGLLEQMAKAFKDQDWLQLSAYSKLAMRKFDNRTFKDIPKDGGAYIYKVQQVTKQLHDYAVQREKDVNKMNELLNGTRHGTVMAKKGAVANSILGLSRAAAKAHQEFLDKAIQHPPDVWRNTYLDLYVDQIMQNEKSAGLVDKAAKSLIDQGYKESAVDAMRQDPRTIVELVVRSSKNSLENAMMPDIEPGLARELSHDAYTELSRLRAMGHKPAYIPTLSPHDIKEGVTPSYNVSIGSLTPRSVGSSFARAFDFTSSIYDVQMGILQDAKEQITKDVTQEFKDEYVSKHLIDVGEANAIAMHYVQDEIAHHTLQHLEDGVRKETVDAMVLAQIKRMGLISYDPENIFGTLSAAKLDKDHYINASLSSALEKTVGRFQFPAEGFWDKGTKVFRFSILGLSPRYTAHILFGGTALIAYRGHLSMLSQLRAGWHVATTGELPKDVLEANPRAAEHLTHNSAQEGMEDQTWHKAAGYTMGNKIIREFMDNHEYTANAIGWAQAAANINFRFTRAITRAQRSIVYLDGAARAAKEGSFSEHVLVPRIDKTTGERVTHPITGKQIFDEKEQRSDMTPERAHNEGMKAVADVMGELRHMTPLERSILTRVFPFYGWTKHVLTYVLTYPVDHPLRATFLSQLATQNSADVASGLPTRIQLLMFLGKPDQYGNVSAVDARFMDPLRDTANYASLTGLFQSLNPIFSAPLATVDPQISFGGNELYPNVSYSQLYGVKEAGPQGNAYNAVEQFVPQVQALDEAFNLSGQYGYLKGANPSAFAQKVAESLNVPFFNVQHINLRQIAATNELDRYSIASNAAYEAASTGDMSYIAGYPSTAELPDPLNTEYNVTPDYIRAMTKESEDSTGLPFTATAKPPPTVSI